MSEPKRFDHLSDGMWQNSAGDYVLHADYASLQAEVEQLTQLRDTASWASERAVNRLQAEVERLRKAGDAMAEVCGWDFIDTEPADRLVANWNAAKEGKQS